MRQIALLGLALLCFPCFAAEPLVTLSFRDVSIRDVSFSIARQTHNWQPKYRIGMVKELQSATGISIDVKDVPLSQALGVLREDHGICAWAIDLPGNVRDVTLCPCEMLPFREDEMDRYELL